MVPSHLRFAAGVCVLTAGLLLGSAWVATAVANADSSNSAARGDGVTNSSRVGSDTAAARSVTLLSLSGRRLGA